MVENLEPRYSVSQPGHQPPKVLFWFKVYSGFLSFVYVLTAAFSLIFFFGDPQDLEMPKAFAVGLGVGLLGISIVLFVACLLPLFLPPKPWVWVYDLVVICFGLTSACFLPACVPLLIYWLKPEVKGYFGRT